MKTLWLLFLGIIYVNQKSEFLLFLGGWNWGVDYVQNLVIDGICTLH